MIADAYMRRHLTRSGFKRLAGAKPDDLFVYTDGDELIHPEILVRNILSDLYVQTTQTLAVVCLEQPTGASHAVQ